MTPGSVSPLKTWDGERRHAAPGVGYPHGDGVHDTVVADEQDVDGHDELTTTGNSMTCQSNI